MLSPNRLTLALLFILSPTSRAAPDLPKFTFTTDTDARAWHSSPHVTALTPTPEGLSIQSTDIDPYITGPARDYPPGQLLWLNLRAKTDRDGDLQIFHFKTHPTEESSIRIPISSGQWQTLRIPLPALGPAHRLRIDPPGGPGQTLISSISFEPRKILTTPTWPKPLAPNLNDNVAKLRTGPLELIHATDESASFSLTVDGKPFATSLNPRLLGYLHNDDQVWLNLTTRGRTKLVNDDDIITVVFTILDQHGATWTLTHRFSPNPNGSAIDVLVHITTDRDRLVTFLPLLLLTPGANAFGTSKTQALFPGLEYLDKDEPSSSEADLQGPQSNRRVPDFLKITFPLMAIAHDDRYVGLIWERNENVAALFDSPDRTFSSGGHVMGVIFPGSNGSNREEGNLLPHYPQLLKANEPVTLKATIIGGGGVNVLPAIQQYTALRNLPKPLPVPPLDDYVRTASTGYLDSAIRETDRYCHAFPGDFRPQPAADAALMMHWLAARSTDAPLKDRLLTAAKSAIAQVPPTQYDAAAISHVRYPAPSLIFGHTLDNARAARQQGLSLLNRFEPDGSLLYKPGKTDYARTHFANHANGLTANLVERLLVCATVSGDEKLIAESLRLLRALDKYKNTAPRGAQTWEIPLHTPDILAAAQLVRAYTLGYELTADPHFLDMAKHWAWTGVPFVYLDNPVDRPAGQYATIAVLGATNWVAPNWLGLPVQWCGLVYADALYRLSLHDPQSHWKQIADGITISGILQSWPHDHPDTQRRGLLPDSFSLRAGIRNDAAINPGTLLANAAHLYDAPLYTFRSLHKSNLLLHAPGRITDLDEQPDRTSFHILPSCSGQYSLLLSRCPTKPDVRINGNPAPDGALQHDPENKLLVIHLAGHVRIEIRR